jgi:hypothetical protein
MSSIVVEVEQELFQVPMAVEEVHLQEQHQMVLLLQMQLEQQHRQVVEMVVMDFQEQAVMVLQEASRVELEEELTKGQAVLTLVATALMAKLSSPGPVLLQQIHL